MTDGEDVLEEARANHDRAFAPYSEYKVGAALVTNEGVFGGGNIEVSGRTTSIHAEMLAMFNAVHAGATEFELMAISTTTQSGVAPCALCAHTLAQFTDDLTILSDNGVGEEPSKYQLDDLFGEGQYRPSTRHNTLIQDDGQA